MRTRIYKMKIANEPFLLQEATRKHFVSFSLSPLFLILSTFSIYLFLYLSLSCLLLFFLTERIHHLHIITIIFFTVCVFFSEETFFIYHHHESIYSGMGHLGSTNQRMSDTGRNTIVFLSDTLPTKWEMKNHALNFLSCQW